SVARVPGDGRATPAVRVVAEGDHEAAPVAAPGRRQVGGGGPGREGGQPRRVARDVPGLPRGVARRGDEEVGGARRVGGRARAGARRRDTADRGWHGGRGPGP